MNYESNAFTSTGMTLILLAMVITTLVGNCSGFHNVQATRHERYIRCIQEGVELVAADQFPYEVCAEGYCKHYEIPSVKESVRSHLK